MARAPRPRSVWPGFRVSCGPHSKRMHAHDRVPLGRTGLRVSRLAQGTGTHGFGGSSNQLRQLGVDGLADLLHAGHDAGLNLWMAPTATAATPRRRGRCGASSGSAWSCDQDARHDRGGADGRPGPSNT